MPLTDAQRAYLNEPRYAVLGILGADNSIWQTVMWYRLEGESIIMNTANGRLKERQLRKNANVSITVEDGYDYLTLSGTATIDDDPDVPDTQNLDPPAHLPIMPRRRQYRRRGCTVTMPCPATSSV